MYEIFLVEVKKDMILFKTMSRRAFSLIELLIVVAIVAVLVGVAMPYYADYVRDTKLTKAKHELDILKNALIKYDTFEQKPFESKDLRILLGKYLQDLPRDPWGRDYEVDYLKGHVKSRGPDNIKEQDDIIFDYKPPLALQKCTWVDMDKNRHVSNGDYLKFEFSRYMKSGQGPLSYSNASPTAAGIDLQFSSEFAVGTLIATSTPASTTELLVEFNGTASDTAFYPGSSTVRIAPTNDNLMDNSDRLANGSNGEYPGLEIIILEN